MDNQQGTYYVPEQSKLPLVTSLALFLLVYGLANWFTLDDGGPFIFALGVTCFLASLWIWFSTVIKENIAGLNNAQVKRSYAWGMGWFICTEVFFFSAFFGALFYLRYFSMPSLDSGPTNELLWLGFNAEWPLMVTPDMAVHGDQAVHRGPDATLSNPGLLNWATWLPFWNTSILLASSITLHVAHTALTKNNKKQFNIWLGITVALGLIFLVLQTEEYIHAYQDLGLTLSSGVYGATFFMLTGFHGAHVILGTIILLVTFLRSVLKGHFKPDDCFGFEAASWYWHFVDVVWVGVFIVVYILG